MSYASCDWSVTVKAIKIYSKCRFLDPTFVYHAKLIIINVNEEVKKAKLLGITFVYNLKWDCEINL